jgi:predicted metal-binding protein
MYLSPKMLNSFSGHVSVWLETCMKMAELKSKYINTDIFSLEEQLNIPYVIVRTPSHANIGQQ